VETGQQHPPTRCSTPELALAREVSLRFNLTPSLALQITTVARMSGI